MIEVYVNNHDDPASVENTVKAFGDYKIEHAEDVSCIYVHDGLSSEEIKALDIIYVRETNEHQIRPLDSRRMPD